MRAVVLSVFAGAMLASAAWAQGGVVTRVVDGDTIDVRPGVRVRLWGIDAPEKSQVCDDGWRAGALASEALRSLVAGHEIRCEDRGKDRYGRMIGLCKAGGVDVGAELVRSGYAWAFVRYSSDYVGDEAKAKAGRLGLWAHGCQPAWDWRAERR
jgi:endonuclease YncB( thermonuclease family)